MTYAINLLMFGFSIAAIVLASAWIRNPGSVSLVALILCISATIALSLIAMMIEGYSDE